jgi:hypothetical protein
VPARACHVELEDERVVVGERLAAGDDLLLQAVARGLVELARGDGERRAVQVLVMALSPSSATALA